MSDYDLAIVVGHSKDAPGAVSAAGVSEFDWNTFLAESIVDAFYEAGISVRVFFRSQTIQGYSSKMARLVEEVNVGSPKACLSLHFNAAFGPYVGKWEGTSALHYPGSVKGQAFAKVLSEFVGRAQNTRWTAKSPGIRGAIAKKHNDDGAVLHIITDTNCPAVLLETHFGDNVAEHSRATTARDSGATAQAILSAYKAVF